MRLSVLSKSQADGFAALLDGLDDNRCVSRSLLRDEDFSEFDMSTHEPGDLPFHTIDDIDCLKPDLDLCSVLSMRDSAPMQSIKPKAFTNSGYLEGNVRSVSPLPDVEDHTNMQQESVFQPPTLTEIHRDYQSSVQRLFQSMQRTDESRDFIVRKRQKLNYEEERCFFGDPNLHQLEHSRQTIMKLLQRESSASLILG